MKVLETAGYAVGVASSRLRYVLDRLNYDEKRDIPHGFILYKIDEGRINFKLFDSGKKEIMSGSNDLEDGDSLDGVVVRAANQAAEFMRAVQLSRDLRQPAMSIP